ncbi:MAG TPA: RimK family alpha-L-glutamate ligase [Candidatus Caccopulliclostridium gallistercoris]|uniref:RimK family alpha-L-glutamate ligase n=1 Tax=Candidatus Caccopulliclostridium gallistercoris TaxID=2840719 RepID=A0A9D1NF29_9FIRM|nr:RimK family alpha-L-glutamate ligase [Candidatus Caccopulliclostridium gallistercoris]
MKKVLIVYDANTDEKSFEVQTKLLFDAAKKLGISITARSNVQIYTMLSNTKVKSFESYANFDFALFLDDDVWLARNLEMLGLKVYNNSRAIDICENCANMYQQLIKCGVNIPKTVILPSALSEYKKETIHPFVDQIIDDLGLPIIIKQWFGDLGRGVHLAKTREQAYEIVDRFEGRELLFQEFISEASGTDIRMYVVRNKVLASLRRTAGKEDFRSNTNFGGIMEKHIPTFVEQKLALDACKAVGCEFGVVDILKSINGPVVCEVNTSANIQYFQEVSDFNVAEHILKMLKK